MSFPFPLNPVDGEQVSHTLPNGVTVEAIYKAENNEWFVTRRDPTITSLTGSVPIQVTPTADRQVITWDSTLNRWVASAPHMPKLTELSDTDIHSKPELGEVPIWRYASGHPESAHFYWGTQPAHLKTWEATANWESGATVFHRGHLWRATHENVNVEPALENGKVTLFIHVTGEPSFGLVPIDVSHDAPPSGLVPAHVMRYAFWLQYTDDNHMTLWKFVIKGKDPSTQQPIGEWEGRPWACLPWRRTTAPPAQFPLGIVMVWIHDRPGGIAQPIVGQQAWALLDLTVSLAMAADVDIIEPADGDFLVYNGTHAKWMPVARTTALPPPAPERHFLKVFSQNPCVIADGDYSVVLALPDGTEPVLTLPDPATCQGRELQVKNYRATACKSSVANVRTYSDYATLTDHITGNAAGSWALLVSDGAAWVKLQAAPVSD